MDEVAQAVLIIVFCGTFSSALQTSASTLSEDTVNLMLAEMSNLREEVKEVRANLEDFEDWKRSTSSDIEDWKKSTISDFEKVDERLRDIEKSESNKSASFGSQVTKAGNDTLEDRVEHLEEVCKTKLARTCEELRNYGVKLDGTQWA